MNLSSPRLLYGAFLALWVVSLIWFGAVTPQAVATVAVGTAILWVASVFLLAEPVRASWSALAVGAAAVAVVALQLLPLPPGLFPYTDALRAKHGVAGRAPGTGDLFLTVRQLAQIGAYVMAGMFVKRLVDGGLKRMDVLAGVVAVLALEGIYAVAQVGFKFEEIPFFGLRPYADSASGTLVNRNNFSGLMAVGLALASAAAWARFTSPRRPRKIVALEGGLPWAIAAALFAACVVIAKSRGGALAAGAGLLVLPFVVRRRVAAASIFAIVLIAGLSTAAVFVSNTEPLLERFETIDPDHVGTDTRVRCWQASIEGWKKQPVLGFGIGSFPETFRPFQPPSLPGQFHHAHNEYVNALFEGGIAWIVVVLLALGLWLWRSLRGLRRLEGSERAAAAACIAAVVATAIHSLVDFDLRITSVGILFAVAVGAALPYRPSIRPGSRSFSAIPGLAVVLLALPLWFAELEPETPALRAAVREPADAEVHLAAILRLSPYDAIAVSMQALQAERRDDIPLAAERLQTACELWPANPEFQRNAALWYLDHGDRDHATVCLRRYFEQRPSVVALTVARRWSDTDPVALWEPSLPTPRAVASFAGLLARMNRWQDAAALFERGVPAEEEYVQSYDALADSFHQAGQWGLEAEIRERRLSIQSDPEAHAAAAAAWSRLEAWDKALDHARIAIRIDPGRADWQGEYAAVLDAKGDRMGAIETLTEALRINPDDQNLRLRRAGVYMEEKLFSLAVDDYRVAAKATPKSRDVVFGLVEALVAAGRKIEALAVVEKWIDSNPDDTAAALVRERLRK